MDPLPPVILGKKCRKRTLNRGLHCGAEVNHGIDDVLIGISSDDFPGSDQDDNDGDADECHAETCSRRCRDRSHGPVDESGFLWSPGACPLRLCGSAEEELVVVQHLFREDFRVVRCTTCGLIRTNPRPTPEWKARFYDPQYNALPEQHGRDFIYAPEDDRWPSYRRLLRFVQRRLPPGGTLLDVGAASGVFVKMAVDVGIDAVACDFSHEALAYAREHFQLRTLACPAEAIDAPNDSYDVVTMFHTIEHLPDPLQVLREMRRVLKPGGFLFLETPNYALHYFAETRMRLLFPLYRLLTKRDGMPWVPFDHYYHWTPPMLRRALRDAGFRDARSHHIMGYRSNSKPNALFWMAYILYDLGAQSGWLLSGGRVDFRLVQLSNRSQVGRLFPRGECIIRNWGWLIAGWSRKLCASY